MRVCTNTGVELGRRYVNVKTSFQPIIHVDIIMIQVLSWGGVMLMSKGIKYKASDAIVLHYLLKHKTGLS